MRLFYLLTGGRPMKQTNDMSFWDNVVHKQVNFYEDYFGRKWMAFNKWSLFRVKVEVKP